MAIKPIDFTKGNLKTKFLSWKAAKGSIARKNQFYQTVIATLKANKKVAHVVNKRAEKRALFKAVREEGLQSRHNNRSGITRNVIKRVLGRIEGSGEFSHREMRLLRKNLVGGIYSKSIIRVKEEPKPQVHAEQKTEQQRHAEVKNIYNEIVNKNSDKKNGSNFENEASQQKKFAVASKALPLQAVDFSASNNNVRKLEPILFGNDRDIKPQQTNKPQVSSQSTINTHGYLANHLYKFGKHEDISKIKSILADIQDKGDNEQEDDLNLAA